MKHKTLLIGLLACAGAVVGCRTASDNRDFVIQRGNDNMYGVVSQPNGKVILSARFKKIEPLSGFFKVVNAGNYVGIYDGKGRCVLPCSFSSVDLYNNQFLVVQNGKKGLYDLKGKNIVPCEYSSIESFNGAEVNMLSKNKSKNDKNVISIAFLLIFSKLLFRLNKNE